MSLRRSLTGGMLDVGFASLATFVVGIVAVRYLPAATLGVYALFFRSLLLVTVVPEQLVLRPTRIEALANARPNRVRVVGVSLRKAAPLAALCAAGTALTVLLVGSTANQEALQALALTTMITAFLSPLQTQVRLVFHLADQSWKAATVSTVQFLTVVLVVGSMLALDVPSAWIPLGALGAANAVSLGCGLLLAAPNMTGSLSGDYSLSHLVRSGRWLLASALIPAIAAFVVIFLIAQLAGNEQLGYAEGARIIAQPVLVFALGLAAVVTPRAMESAATRDESRARRLSRMYDLAVVGVTLFVIAAFGFEWPWNLLADLLPNAYVVTGLVAFTVIANGINAMVKPEEAQLAASGRERKIVSAEAAASAVRVVTGATAGVTQAFALPLSLTTSGIVRVTMLKRSAKGIYHKPSVDA